MARLLSLILLLGFASLAEATVVISEVLADPPSGAAGDANQDGQRSTYEDEFIELYNAGSASVDISGWRLGDSSSPDNFFQFPSDAVIEPGSYVVLFGGGNPTGFTVPVYTDDGRIGNGLTNSGEHIRLLDNTNTEVASVSHDEWPKDQSIVRNPSDSGEFAPHKTASPTGAPFSPGRAIAAESQTPETPEIPKPETPETSEPETPETPEIPKPETPETSEPETPSKPTPTYALVISEVLADPPSGAAGDANQDGQRNTYEDEFIELYNAGSTPISLAGWRLGDSSSPDNFFQFPSDAVIEPGSYVVLFGGGNPTGFTVPVYTDDGRIGNGLTNSGEHIRLLDNTNTEVASVSHDEWPKDQSIVRNPSDSGEFAPHKTASPTGAPFSPGRAIAAESQTPETPEIPEPETPETPEIPKPETPETPEIPEPEAPETPEIPEPEAPEIPEIPKPETPEIPEIPKPETPETPEIPKPETPETPEIPKPETPETPEIPKPETPEIPEIPKPETPEIPEIPKPETPETPEIPEIPKPETPETSEPETPSKPTPTYALVISEVLADPPSGTAGDANQDGQRDTYEDEFIELYNAGSTPISLAGWRLGDSSSPDNFFQFPSDAVIEPNSYIVLFGGGNPTGFSVPVYTDDGKIGGNGLTNKGEEIRLIDDNGHEIPGVSHDEWPIKQSLVRHPPDGDQLIPHNTASTTKALFSPGHTHIIPKPDYPLFISEVLADPPSGLAGDANRDGRRDTYEDEFVELYNAGSVSVSLAGWRLGDSTSPKRHFRFPSGAVIAPRSYMVLFGGGNPSGFTLPIYTDDGKIGNGLINKGEEIRLIDDNGYEVDVVSHDEWPKDQSIVRTPSDGGAFVPHKMASPIEASFSPGHAPETRPILTYPLFISEVLADPPAGPAGDANQDGQYNPHEDEFIELYNAGPVPVSLAGWRLGDAGSLSDYFRFPRDAVIAPRSYVVLFGGGNPLGFTIPVYTDDGTIGDGLTNSGESIHLINDHGHEAASLFQSTWPKDQSIVRTPSDGGAFVPHKMASPIEASFSPGHAPETRPILTYPLFISEVLADPPVGPAGDANQDGQRNPYEDEFIELYNAGPVPVSLAGWRLGDAGSLSDYFRFPRDAVIEPDSYVVLFGGGAPAEFPVPVYADDGTIGDGLTNSGESIHLIDNHGYEVSFLFQSTWPYAQSLVRISPDSSAFVPHQTASLTQASFSPGRAIDAPSASAAKISAMASATSLHVWPNPFNATTHFGFYVRQTAAVHVAIYNVQGQLVRTLVDAPLHAGLHQMRWDGRDERGYWAATGLYFARFHIAHNPPHYAKLLLLR